MMMVMVMVMMMMIMMMTMMMMMMMIVVVVVDSGGGGGGGGGGGASGGGGGGDGHCDGPPGRVLPQVCVCSGVHATVDARTTPDALAEAHRAAIGKARGVRHAVPPALPHGDAPLLDSEVTGEGALQHGVNVNLLHLQRAQRRRRPRGRPGGEPVVLIRHHGWHRPRASERICFALGALEGDERPVPTASR
jgi:hypothetical protein